MPERQAARPFAVVIPVYHGVAPMLEDLLDSLDVYLGAPYHVVVVDDHTTDGTAAALEAMGGRRPNLTVLPNERHLGWGWGVYRSLGRGVGWALANLEFGALLKLDHDSLLIGPGLGARLGALFAEPKMGLVGCLQPEPNRWVWDWRLRPEVKRAAREGGYLAVMNGFPWSAQAGVLALGRGFLEGLEKRGWLAGGFERFGTNGLTEDALLPILCYALGFRALNAGFVISTHGSEALLRTPYRLMRDLGVVAIHPVKQGMSHRGRHNASDHPELRGYFRELRELERR